MPSIQDDEESNLRNLKTITSSYLYYSISPSIGCPRLATHLPRVITKVFVRVCAFPLGKAWEKPLLYWNLRSDTYEYFFAATP